MSPSDDLNFSSGPHLIQYVITSKSDFLKAHITYTLLLKLNYLLSLTMSGKAKAKMVPMDPSKLGFGQIPSFERKQADGTDSWKGQEDGEKDPGALAIRTADAYATMIKSYVADEAPSAISGLNAWNPRTKTWTTYLASVVKKSYIPPGTRRPANGPLSRMHATLNAVVGANVHRTGFSCAEMNAVNNMLWDVDQTGRDATLQIKGLIVTKGTPDKDDKGPGGGKATMVPCSSTGPGVLGCGDVLQRLGVTF